MFGQKLHVEEYDSSREEPLDRADEPHLRGVAHAVEHAFCGEQRTALHAVQAAYQLVALPDLDAVRVSERVQFAISVDHFRQDPSAGIALAAALQDHVA